MTSNNRQRQSSIQDLHSPNNNNHVANHLNIPRNHLKQSLTSSSSQHVRSCESINYHHNHNHVPIQQALAVDDNFNCSMTNRATIPNHNSSVQRSSFYSMWNMFKYEFNHRFRNKFNFDSPICLLGQLYHSKMDDFSEAIDDEKHSNLYAYGKFKKDYFSRIWLTYRKDFPPLLNTNLTNDNGWGCMIRSGQMIMAQAMLSHFLGRNWRWDGRGDDLIHRMIIKWFADNPDKITSPFSIHEIVRMGVKFGKNPGDWFGPASISVIFKHLLEDASKRNVQLNDICCYIAQDCTVYLQDVIDLCENGEQSNEEGNNSTQQPWRSVIILIPVRLGGDNFNIFYAPYLKQILSMPFCLGVIGGKPRHSLYFIGFQNDKLLAIDPHYCQKTVDVHSGMNFPLDSFHCTASPRRISIQSIDPSCTIGFYLKTKDEYDEFITLTNQMLDHSYKTGGYPIFTLDKRKYSEQTFMSTTPTTIKHDQSMLNESSSLSSSSGISPTQSDKILQMQYRLVDKDGNVQKILSSEEFVLL